MNKTICVGNWTLEKVSDKSIYVWQTKGTYSDIAFKYDDTEDIVVYYCPDRIPKYVKKKVRSMFKVKGEQR